MALQVHLPYSFSIQAVFQHSLATLMEHNDERFGECLQPQPWYTTCLYGQKVHYCMDTTHLK